jgi:hypothetical protein
MCHYDFSRAWHVYYSFLKSKYITMKKIWISILGCFVMIAMCAQNPLPGDTSKKGSDWDPLQRQRQRTSTNTMTDTTTLKKWMDTTSHQVPHQDSIRMDDRQRNKIIPDSIPKPR